MSKSIPNSDKVSVCILNSAHPFHDTRVNRIATTLARCGHSVSFISPVIPAEEGNRNEASGSVKYIENRKASGNFVAKHGFVAILRTFFTRLLVMYGLFIKGWSANTDVYHCNELDSWFVGILLKIFSRKKLIFDIHEYYPATIIEFIPGSKPKLFVEKICVWLFSLLSRLTDQAIFVNQSIADLYKFKCRYIILRTLIRSEEIEFIGKNVELEERYNGKVVLLHVGPLREAWGTIVLLDALGIIKDKFPFVLIVLGGIHDGKENYHKKVAELELEQHLIIVDQIPFTQVLEYLNIANLGLVAVQPWSKSLVYSLPRKFLEYICAGLPVIASDFPEIRHLVQKYQLGLLIDPENPHALASAIETIALNPEMAASMSNNCKTAFRDELNWEKESIKLIDLYSSFPGQ
jgi:glycosyltransferase involved in cell wall biosynthesis